MNRIEFHAMGSRILAIIDNATPAAERALQRLPGWFEEWEQVLSRFRFDSDLSKLNQSAGQPVVVNETLWDVFMAARTAEQFTGGLVRPAILNALVHAGYDRSFELLPVTGFEAPAAAFDLPELTSAISWDEPSRTIWLPGSVQLDFGGVAKGWAACKAASRLMEFGPALVDAGGDIAISAPRLDGAPWPIGIRDPFHPGMDFATLRLESGGVATSGTDYHRWQQGHAWNHHLIDPATGLPAVSDVLASTIIAPDTRLAEAAAKAVVIAGSQSGFNWLEADPTLAGVLILHSGELLYSRRMQAFLWR